MMVRVLPIVLALGLGCAQPDLHGAAAAPGREAPADGDLFAVVPAEAELVLALDISELRTSPWTRSMLASGAEQASGRGFDVVTDVDRMMVVRMPSDTESLTVSRGRFDRERVAAAFRARRPGASADHFRGCALWAKDGDAVAFLTGRTLLAGPLASVRSAIDVAYGRGRDVREEKWLLEVRRRYGKMPRPPVAELAVQVTDAMRARLRHELDEAEALERLGGRLDLGRRLDLAIVGTTSTGSHATLLTERLLAALRELQARPSVVAIGLSDVLADVEVASQGPRIAAALQLTESQRNDIALRLSAVAKLLAESRSTEEEKPSP
jgi:hypothetical protein